VLRFQELVNWISPAWGLVGFGDNMTAGRYTVAPIGEIEKSWERLPLDVVRRES
jgi:hypothetical protein